MKRSFFTVLLLLALLASILPQKAAAAGTPTIEKQEYGSNTAYIKGYENNEFRPQNNMTRAEACTIIARLLDKTESFRGKHESSFADVTDDKWYYDFVAYLEKNGFLDRYKGKYDPEGDITRAQFAELAYLAGDFWDKGDDVRFTDVPENHDFYRAITAAAGSGLVNGYEDNTFRPDNTITRAEVVTIINRAVGLFPDDRDLKGTEANIFSDIAGHWAYNNIVVASNSNFVPRRYLDIDLFGVSEDRLTISFENHYFRYVIAKERASVLKLVDKTTGKELKLTGSRSFCALVDENYNQTLPGRAEIVNDLLTVSFADGTVVRFIVLTRGEYITFEVDDEIPESYRELVFANCSADIDRDVEDPFCIIGYAMTFWTNMSNYPDGLSNNVSARCFRKFGVEGAKFALIAAPKSQHREIMKLVNEEIYEGDLPVSSKGGANALDYPGSFGDYVIISDSAESKVPGWIEMCTTYGIDQLDFHRGGNTFLNGSFQFTKYKSGAEFKEKVSDPLREAGVICGLHSYSQYIEPGDALLADPYWQKQLNAFAVYTLREELNPTATSLVTRETPSTMTTDLGFSQRGSLYLLIDEEILRITALNGNKVSVSRGQCGTKAAAHAADARIVHLDGVYGMIMPDPDSELYLLVARNTAKAYNEGGFEMIYLDAFDGLSRHVKSDESWYYYALFVNELLKYCEIDPILEYSSMMPSIWVARTRMGAWDHARMGFKQFVKLHIQSNETYVQRYLPTTLGWYHLYPTDSYEGNTNSSYHFFDDTDYIGAMCIAYDMSMVHQGTETIATMPAFRRNIERYNLYAKLRKTNYFSQAIKDQIKNGKYEYALVQKEDGAWVFYEKSYAMEKLYDINTAGRSDAVFSNPFEEQEPVIRIEGHYSTDGSGEVLLLDMKESTDLNNQAASQVFAQEKNLKKNRALKVRVLGNKSSDAICIRLNCVAVGDSAVADYIIRLDFEGWREFILAERDNKRIGEIAFAGRTVSAYSFYRGIFNYERVTGIAVYTKGPCSGVKISDITACALLENPIENPVLICNGKKISFGGTIGGSEYLEYFPGEKTAKVYDRVGNDREVEVEGGITAAAGNNTVSVSCDKNSEIPYRATVTLGFTGKELT